jgi:hypothetical protein
MLFPKLLRGVVRTIALAVPLCIGLLGSSQALFLIDVARLGMTALLARLPHGTLDLLLLVELLCERRVIDIVDEGVRFIGRGGRMGHVVVIRIRVRWAVEHVQRGGFGRWQPENIVVLLSVVLVVLPLRARDDDWEMPVVRIVEITVVVYEYAEGAV